MAAKNSSEVQDIVDSSSGIVNKTAYRGNVQVIPVTISDVDGGDVVTLAKTLPQNTVVIGIDICIDTDADGDIDIGTGTLATAIIAQEAISGSNHRILWPNHATTGAGRVGSVQVGGEELILTANSDVAGNTVANGHILIATQE